MISRQDIEYSNFNIFGRLGIFLLIVALLFANFFIFYPLADNAKPGVGVFFFCQLMFVFLSIFLFIVWSAISLFAAICYWTIKGEWEFDLIVKSPTWLGAFIIKFICGDWNRANLFRKSE